MEGVNLNIQFPMIYLPFWCPIYQDFSKGFGNLSVPPGETVKLDWGQLEVWFGSAQPSPEQIELCFWTSSPNGKVDDDRFNDLHCTSFLINGTANPSLIEFNVAPNPSSGEIDLHYSLPDGATVEASIFDSYGRLIQVFDMTAPAGSFSMKDFPAGMYLLVLKIDGHVVRTEKLVRI
ncbi:MAG: T9SS type A sorting domain-containing protein [Bacteroidota bacterium]